MRTKLSFTLLCSVCGDELVCDMEDESQTRVTANSAFVANAQLAIKPCPRCIATAEQPIRMIREGLGMIDEQCGKVKT